MSRENQKRKMPIPFLLIILIFLAIFIVVVYPLDLLIKTVLLFSLIVTQLVIAYFHSRSENK